MEQSVFDTNRLVPTYFKQALPVVMGSVVTVIYNLVDTFFIAQTGNAALVAGVSICGPVFIILMAFGNIYGQGASSLVSRLLGRAEHDRVGRISSFAFYFAILTGLVLAVPMLLFRYPVLRLLGSDADTLPYARQYYTILAVGAPVVILNFIHSNLLRCEGMSTLSMLGTLGGAVVNIILDPIFISTLGWGAAGAAAASVLGYIFSAAFFLVIVLRRSRYLSIDPRRWRISGGEFRQILTIGITVAVSNLASSVSMIFMNQFLLRYGAEKIAAMGIVGKINMFAQMVLVGFSFGGMPLFGYLYGAGEIKKMKRLLRFCLLYLAALSLLLTAVLFIAAPNLVRIFMDSGSIVADGTAMLRWQVAGAVFAGVVMLLTCVFQGTGQAGPALILSLSRQGILYLIVLAAAVWIAEYQGFLASQAVADLLSAALAILMYARTFGKREDHI